MAKEVLYTSFINLPEEHLGSAFQNSFREIAVFAHRTPQEALADILEEYLDDPTLIHVKITIETYDPKEAMS